MKHILTRRFREGLATTLLFLLALVAAILFIMPTVLTITNSFMTEKEITANYGAMIENATQDKKTYIAADLNLKFIPDRVSLQQFATVLFKSPDYLLKFWNSVILVVPITVFQILLAAVTAYGFSRYRGRLREIIFFSYIMSLIDADALPGHARAELPRLGLARHPRHALGDRAARHLLALLRLSADQGHAAHPEGIL